MPAKVDPLDQVITDQMTAVREYQGVKMLGVDIETSGLDRHDDEVMVISLSALDRPPAVLHVVGRPMTDVIQLLNSTVLLGHNITSFDLPFLVKHGYDLMGSAGWVDTMIAEQLCITSNRRDVRKSLAATVKRRVGKTLDKDVDHAGWGNSELSLDQLLYAVNDVVHLHDVWAAQQRRLADLKLEAAIKTEWGAQRATAVMCSNGIPLMVEELEGHLTAARAEMTKIEEELRRIGGEPINPTSHAQVRRMFKRLGLELDSTDQESLARVRDRGGELGRLADLVMTHRQLKKSAMYDEDWVRKHVSSDGRVRSSYWQLGTDTGRYSCSDINLQQWPKAMRRLVGYPDHAGRVILSADYSQIEILIASVLSGESRLTQAVLESDVHTYVASLIFGVTEDQVDRDHRRMAKAASFTLLFAGGTPGIVRSTATSGEPISPTNAAIVKDQFYRAFPKVLRYVEDVKRQVAWRQTNNMAMTVRIPGGPVRSLFGMSLSPSTVINTMVQGTAAVGLKRSLRRICRSGLGKYLIAVVHDEVVLDMPKEEVDDAIPVLVECMREGMNDAIGVKPRVETKVGTRWQG